MEYYIDDQVSGIYAVILTAQKMKFSIKDLFSKCDQIHTHAELWFQ